MSRDEPRPPRRATFRCVVCGDRVTVDLDDLDSTDFETLRHFRHCGERREEVKEDEETDHLRDP
ncbi:MAG: hypothetical protein M3416_03805 [Acidobacteriota bacterium]|nr:hypothetical protein [Acidobacteriota bacterium]